MRRERLEHLAKRGDQEALKALARLDLRRSIVVPSRPLKAPSIIQRGEGHGGGTCGYGGDGYGAGPGYENGAGRGCGVGEGVVVGEGFLVRDGDGYGDSFTGNGHGSSFKGSLAGDGDSLSLRKQS